LVIRHPRKKEKKKKKKKRKKEKKKKRKKEKKKQRNKETNSKSIRARLQRIRDDRCQLNNIFEARGIVTDSFHFCMSDWLGVRFFPNQRIFVPMTVESRVLLEK